jgi:hypothetical protein
MTMSLQLGSGTSATENVNVPADESFAARRAISCPFDVRSCTGVASPAPAAGGGIFIAGVVGPPAVGTAETVVPSL